MYSTDGRDTGFLQNRRLAAMSKNICNTAISSGRCVAAYTIRVVYALKVSFGRNSTQGFSKFQID